MKRTTTKGPRRSLLLVLLVICVSTLGDELPVPYAPADAKRVLPVPDGNHSIGVRSFYWVDVTRSKSGLPNAEGVREISATVWYPAIAERGQKSALYAPGVDTILAAADKVPDNRRQFILAHQPLLGVAANGMPDADPVIAENGWPVILFHRAEMSRDIFRLHWPKVLPAGDLCLSPFLIHIAHLTSRRSPVFPCRSIGTWIM